MPSRFVAADSDFCIVGARLFTMEGAVTPLDNYALVLRGSEIAWLGPMSELYAKGQVLDAQGGAVIPGLIDAHTHFLFAGDRIEEFAARSRGVTYEDVAKSGGGIWRTVQATRAASHEELFALGLERLRSMRRLGTTCVEGKSGYGLTEASERKLLEVYKELERATGVRIVRTFLGAHIRPPDYEGRDYVGDTLVWLRGFAAERLCDAVDVFVEENAFSPADARRIGEAARALGLPIHLHVDQLTAGGGAALAAELSALSADHLEHMREGDAELLARAGVTATVLPFATLLVGRGAKPKMAALRAAHVPFAIATDYNPGSAPVLDLPAAALLAIGLFGLSVDEALLGITTHAARALGLQATHGVLRAGAAANVLVLQHQEPASLFYATGPAPIRQVIVAGKITS